MSKESILSKLNEGQRKAVLSNSKNLIIIAGAGTGKTHTLISRLAYCIESGVKPENILLLTFTNNAADEMKARAAKMAGDACEKVTACTYHSFCAAMLRIFYKFAYLPRNFKILSPTDAEDILRLIIADNKNEFKISGMPRPAGIVSIYSAYMNTGKSIDELMSNKNDAYPLVVIEKVKKLYEAYKNYKYEHGMLDFDDLLMEYYHLLSNKEAHRLITNRFKFIMVDEFQDSNNLQNAIVDKMLTDDTQLTVVGDDYQSIYAFRGSNVQNFLDFENKHKPCERVMLTENYRSSQEILDFANGVMDIQANFGYKKKIVSSRNGNRPVIITPPANDETEAEEVLDIINAKLSEGIPAEEIAVLYRNTMSARRLEAKMKLRGLGYKMYGGTKFFDLDLVRNILAFQKVIINPYDETQWFRILSMLPEISDARGTRIARNCGEPDFLMHTEFEGRKTKTAETICAALHKLNGIIIKVKETEKPSDQIELVGDYYIELMNNRIENLSEKLKQGKAKEESVLALQAALEMLKEEVIPVLVSVSKDYNTLLTWMDAITLDQSRKEDPNGIILSTIHSAKGLEWDTVILLDCVDYIFPGAQHIITFFGEKTYQDSVEEELRCFYVAITRAKNTLVIACPKTVFAWGKCVPGESLFLSGAEEWADIVY